MKKNILKGFLILGIAVLAFSCKKDYLDTAPESADSPATIFESTENARMAINGIAKMMTTQYLSTQGLNGEGSIKNWYGNYSGNDTQKANLTGWALLINSNHHESPASVYLYYPWYYYYKVIGNANAVIANIDNADGPQIERDFIKAQALVYRAYSYSQLVQFYCQRWSDGAATGEGLPLRLDTSTGDLAKTSKAGVYAQIYTDLNDAIALFKGSGLSRGADENYLPDVDVAYAVYARAALNREDWATAANYAALARQGHPLMSAAQYKSGFNTVNDEWIWSVYEAADQTLYYYSFFAYCGSNSSANICRSYPFVVSKELVDQIPATDSRRDVFLIPTDAEFNETDASGKPRISRTNGSATAGTFFNRAAALRGTAITDLLYSTSSIFMNMQVKLRATFMPGGGCFHLFRAGEMAFIEAEAACHTNNETRAQAIMEEVNKTYDPGYTCTKTGANLLKEVKLYRRWHLWGEGQDWFDYKRWGDPIQRKSFGQGGNWHSTFAITIAPGEKNNWTFMIPNREKDYNKLIDQMAE